MSTPFKMKGFSGFGNSPVKQAKNKKEETSLEKARRGLGLTKEQLEKEKKDQQERLRKYEEKHG